MTKHYLAVCAIFRDETSYLLEWIAFHRLVGVEHFFLYDNYSVDNPESVLAPLIAEGYVTLCRWEIPFHLGAAKTAYTDCLEKTRGKVRWLACLDMDEFLFAPQETTLIPVLRDYEDYPGIVVRWQVYGSSGQDKASDLPVIARFQQRAQTNWIRNLRVKSIVDPSQTIKAINPHYFLYQNDQLAVDENKQSVKVMPKKRSQKQIRPFYALLGPLVRFFDPYGATQIDRKSISVNRLRINHYPVKSREEFLKKAQYKKEKRRYEGVDYFAYHDRNEVYDPILTRYLPDLEKILSHQK